MTKHPLQVWPQSMTDKAELLWDRLGRRQKEWSEEKLVSLGTITVAKAKGTFHASLKYFHNYYGSVTSRCFPLFLISKREHLYVGGFSWSFPGSSAGKEFACNAGDPCLIPGLESSPAGGRGNPLQYSCLENPHGQRSLVGYSPWGCSRTQLSE